MVSKKKKRELMERIIDLAESVENREVDPFEVDVFDFLERLREIFPEAKTPEELLLDIQAILGLTDVISQQEDWIRHKSSLLHFDPMLVTWKVRDLSEKQLAYVLINSWHPTVELECISRPGIEEAINYWDNLAPISERGTELETTETSPEEISREELSEFGFESREDFDEMIEKTWEDLKKNVGEEGQISYWRFIDSDSFQETVKNAWLVSFMVSYGYATIEINPLEEEITLKPREKKETPSERTGTSVPIAITFDDWKRRKKQNA
ncbi:hypothetical protein AKJ57_02775 [candidate division MSBL1 archaeon SCGC-AAA259A05]|uniref:Non-structural maintenance of chromosome element 4 C-terminal domain-containing protein n=1 Tax=candidate division MSBL1 archaeon SCGC-AAA259A05 TaxID=1698259 RepID=A0A133U9Z0_9EURY|nr:hypothetical protein AKJ57_02775 [candidate division MSBL1 archaeon SCGC-AAA259A05]